MNYQFTFTPMPKVIMGAERVDTVGEQALHFGRTTLLITGSEALARAGHLARIRANLKNAGQQIFDYRIPGEPTPAMIDGAVGQFSGKAVDCVVAVGGGSVLDAGKAIAAMLMASGSVADFLEGTGKARPSGDTLPVIAVPTTSGTGSEATKNAVISQVASDGFKKSLRHDNFVPRIAIIDPVLCVSAPPSVTAACGMDALTQLIESYVSSQASPLTDALALDGLRHLIPALPLACGTGAEDLECRGAVAYGAFLSGVTLANAGLGVVHGVAGPMGGIIAIPHGVACANLLPAAVAATIDNLTAAKNAESQAVITKFARIGRLFDDGRHDLLDRCRRLVDGLYRWLDDLQLPRLANFGLTMAHVDRLVRTASNKNNPLPLSQHQIRQVLLSRY